MYIPNLLLRGYGEMVHNSKKLYEVAELLGANLQNAKEDSENPQEMYCAACNAPVSATSKFCSNCGAMLD